MNFEGISAIVFVVLVSAFLFFRRKKIKIEKVLYPAVYFILYRTKLGIKLMDRIAQKCRKTWHYFNYFSIGLGFLGMAAICFLLLHNLYSIFFIPGAVSGVGLVLPFKVKGAFFVPFFYWIIAILVIATVHESFHGIIARYYNIKLKSSGFAFLAILAPIIPAAFVEPDEKTLFKRPVKQQLAVFSAGATSNIILGAVFLLIILFVVQPLTSSMFQGQVSVAEVTKGAPADLAGLKVDETLVFVDDVMINSSDDFINVMANKTPGSNIQIKTDSKNYAVTLAKNPKNESKSYIGISILQKSVPTEAAKQKYGGFIPAAILWLTGLFFFLYVLNLGIGLFNLVPVGPIDGGRMLNIALKKYFKKNGAKIFKFVSILFLLVIIINIAMSFIK